MAITGIGTAVAGLGQGIAQGIAGIEGAKIQGEYQKQLQQTANEFTEKQSKNQIKYNVEQMKDLGFSPSMLFGGGASATGGGAGGGKSASAPDFATPLMQAFNTVGKILQQDSKNDLRERELDLQQQRINQLDNQIGIDRDYKATRNEIYQNYLDKKRGIIRSNRNMTREFDSLDDLE